jgi:nucleolar protein 4
MENGNIVKKKKYRPKKVNLKKGRLIVRNLSFKITDEVLKKEFEKFGELTEVNILKKPDGKLVGCAFLQYSVYGSAINAIKSLNGKELLSRKISVAFAVSKNKFQKGKSDSTSEEDEDADDEVKQEEDNDDKIKDEDVKDEEEDKSKDDSADEEEDYIKLESTKTQVTEDSSSGEVVKKKKYNQQDHDFTIFIKNISYDTTNEDLQECFKKFGPIKYALIVRDPVSGHSKGTGFVRFLRKESVEVCLTQSNKIILQDFTLEILPSISKDRVKAIEKEKIDKKEEPKDGRNLYLLREGMIMAGSEAAEGVSATDMAKRLRLEQLKSAMLKNLTRFIAKERLTIHNIPENIDDLKLRKMVEKKTNLKPIECRVMLENKPSPGFPKGKSKGFGFLSFKCHEDALAVLRKLNNNPDVFGTSHRPIVSFSIEDMNVMKIKEKRALRSKINNPTYQKKMEDLKLKRLNKRKERKERNKNDVKSFVDKSATVKKINEKSKKASSKIDEGDETTSYSGFASKPGPLVKLRGTFKLKEQSRIHEKSMKERNKIVRREKQLLEVRKERKEKQFDRATSNKRKLDVNDSLSTKIDKYKSLINGNNNSGEVESKKPKVRGKWFIE